MSKHLVRSEPFIKLVANSKPHQRNVLLRNATKEQLKALCEVCLNTIRGNLRLPPIAVQKLKRHRKTLEALANRRVPLYKKRHLINQKGGVLGQVAAFALPVLAQVIAGAVKSAIKGRKKRRNKKK